MAYIAWTAFLVLVLPLWRTQAPLNLPTRTPTAAIARRGPADVPALQEGRTAVFISTDMGGDDIVAVLYLLSHPDVQVLGIGSSEGLAYLEAGARNALQLLALVGQEDIPVAVGKEGPLEGDNAFPSSWRGGSSRPLSSPIPPATTEPVQESTSELLAKVVDAYPGQVTVVILGAHTDVAMALREDPSLAERIRGIVIMGGAVFVPGNIHKEHSSIANETAEWNLSVDYVAAAEVFAAGIPLHMIPLDATDLVEVDRERYEAFASRAQSAAAQAVESMWRRRASGPGFFIWDVVATVALTLPDAAEWQFLPIEVVTDDPDNLGQTRVNEALPPNVHVSVSVDAQATLDEIARVLNSEAP
jgi:inosine-uridine nucleoside N-ribohydrolase